MFNQKSYVSPYYSPTNILFAHPLIKGYINDKDLISMEIKMLDLEILDFNLNDLEKEVEEHLISRKNSDERYKNQDINIALQSSLKPLIASNLRHNLIIVDFHPALKRRGFLCQGENTLIRQGSLRVL